MVIKKIVLVSLAISSSLFSFSNRVNAAAISLIEANLNININVNGNPASITGGNQSSPLNITYEESDENFELRIATNANFDGDEDYAFDIVIGELWEFDLNFGIKNTGITEDESVVEINGFVFHDTKPRGTEHDNDEDQGEKLEISFPSFSLEENENDSRWSENTITFSKPGNVNHNPNHTDQYYENKLRLTRVDGDEHELSSLLYTLKGRHKAVPEPTTILGSATALGFGALLKRRNSKKQNKS